VIEMIKVNLNSEQFKYDGTHNGKDYDSLKIYKFGNGRVYFMALSESIKGKVGTFAKQMQFVNGQIFISFGKKGKLNIGTYVEE
jgi:hypothetical protein